MSGWNPIKKDGGNGRGIFWEGGGLGSCSCTIQFAILSFLDCKSIAALIMAWEEDYFLQLGLVLEQV